MAALATDSRSASAAGRASCRNKLRRQLDSTMENQHVSIRLRKIAAAGFGILALAGVAATTGVSASAAVWNSRDCKLYGVCAPGDQELGTYSGTFALPGGGRTADSDVRGRAVQNTHDCKYYGICPWSSPRRDAP